MTDFEGLVFTVLSNAATAAAGRIYPYVAPDRPVLPFVVYLEVANVPENLLTGPPPIDNTKMQIDCYALTAYAARQLADQVNTALFAATTFKLWWLDSRGGYEAEVKLYRITNDFSVWSN